MTKIFLFVSGVCLGVLCGLLVGYSKGKQSAAVQEFKTYRADLISYYGFPENRKLPLADFLKARYYYFANRIPGSALGTPYDYGDVAFGGLTIGKGPTTPQREYQLFKEKRVVFRQPQLRTSENVVAPLTLP